MIIVTTKNQQIKTEYNKTNKNKGRVFFSLDLLNIIIGIETANRGYITRCSTRKPKFVKYIPKVANTKESGIKIENLFSLLFLI